MRAKGQTDDEQAVQEVSIEATNTAGPQVTQVCRAVEETKTTYDRLSRCYDLLTCFGERDLTEAGLRALRVRSGERVLEVGFGSGRGLLALGRMIGESGLVHGIDISEGMCRVAQRKVRDAGLDDRVTLTRGDARVLPYGTDEFDAVFLSFTVELFDEPDAPLVLRECRRTLREQGRLGVVSLSQDQELGLVGRLYQWLHTKFPRYLDCRPIPVEHTLRDAGFEPSDTGGRSLWGLPVAIVVATSATRPDGNRQGSYV